MILLDREMVVNKTTTTKSQTSLYCQASFNSDGVLTLRNYNIENKNSDEIIILSHEETQAIFDLVKKMAKINSDVLPF